MTSMTTTASPSLSPIAERLAALRAKMRASAIDALWVGAGDPYLSEYVPEHESLRAYLSGFTGSMGDLVITRDRAIIVVDGRYRLQVKSQAPDFEPIVVPLGTTITEGWLNTLDQLKHQGVQTLGLESARTPVATFDAAVARAKTLGLDISLVEQSLVEQVRQDLAQRPPPRAGTLRPCPAEISGSVEERLNEAAPRLTEGGRVGQLIVALDEIAWIVNARGDYFPFQATFPARAIVFEREVWLELHDPRAVAKSNIASLVQHQALDWSCVRVVDSLSAVLAERCAKERDVVIGYDSGTTTVAARKLLEDAGAIARDMKSPFFRTRTIKSRSELAHMVEGFHRADVVVNKLQSWLGNEVSRGVIVTEADVATKLTQLYAKSGAKGLSFRPICGADEHGAIIHYGTPDATTPLKEGAVFLCDSGAYYEGGYATDLTRTFVVGKNHVVPTARQKMLFTAVLKSAIAGMRARIPKGTSGDRLDAIVRAPLWAAGLDYAHGTGHGVGVNVHEFPPRVAPRATTSFEVGQVFSIEPGVYLDGEIGIRIENLCTLDDDPDNADFWRVRPLTFSPLDKRLIDKSQLTGGEKAFLTWFAEGFKASKKDPSAALTLPLPPLAP